MAVRRRLPISDDELRQFCELWRISKLELFGSALRDDFRDDSDIDLLVTWREDAAWSLFDHVHIEDELGSLLGRKVDLVSRHLIETSDNPFASERSSRRPVRLVADGRQAVDARGGQVSGEDERRGYV